MGLGLGILLWPKKIIEDGPTQGSARTDVVGVNPRIYPKLRVAVMADIHNDLISLQKALDKAKGDGDSLVVVAGDVTINGTENEQKGIMKVLDDSGQKYAVVPGNHDIYKKIWLFDKKYQSIREAGAKFILIDNSDWRGLGTEQKLWIEGEVAECQKILCLVVMHEPLLNNFSKHVMGEYSSAAAGEAIWLKNILVENGVKIGYSGHLHYASDYVIDGWETVLVGAISKDRNVETPRFTEVVMYDDGSINNQVKILE